MRKRVGFSLAEVLVLFMITSIFVLVTVPVFSMLKKSNAPSVTSQELSSCIKELKDNPAVISFDSTTGKLTQITSDNCKTAVNRCTAIGGNDCLLGINYADSSITAENIAGRKFLRASCDNDGTDACEYFLEKCKSDSTSLACNDTTSPTDVKFADLHYYLVDAFKVVQDPYQADKDNLGSQRMLYLINSKNYYTSSATSNFISSVATFCRDERSAGIPGMACKLIYDTCNSPNPVNHACQTLVDNCYNNNSCDTTSVVATFNDYNFYDLKNLLESKTAGDLSNMAVYNYIVNPTLLGGQNYFYAGAVPGANVTTFINNLIGYCNSPVKNTALKDYNLACKLVNNYCEGFANATACNYFSDKCSQSYGSGGSNRCDLTEDYDYNKFIALETGTALADVINTKAKTYLTSTGNTTLVTATSNACSANPNSIACRSLYEQCNSSFTDQSCKFFINVCQQDSTRCDYNANTMDLKYYLEQPDTETGSVGKVKNLLLSNGYYGNVANVTNTIDAVCPGSTNNGTMACTLKIYDWIKYFGGGGDDDAFRVTADNGYLYISGRETSSAYNNYWESFLLKMDLTGNILWKKRYDYGYYTYGYATRISANNIFFANYAAEYGNRARLYPNFIRADLNGNVIWKKTLNTYYAGLQGLDIAAGNMYLYGLFYGTNDDMSISKVDLDGNIAWNKQSNGIGYEQIRRVVNDGTKLYSAVLQTNTSGSYWQPAIITFDLDGNVLWAKTLSYSLNHAYAYDIIVAGDYVYLTGMLESGPAGSRDIFLTKFDKSGNIVWNKTIGASSNEMGYGLGTDGSNIYIGGASSNNSYGSYDAVVLKMDSNANILWQKRVGSVSDDYFEDVTIVNGDVYAVGHTGFANRDALVAKFNDKQTSNLYLTVSNNPYSYIDWQETFTFTDVPSVSTTTGGTYENLDAFGLSGDYQIYTKWY